MNNGQESSSWASSLFNISNELFKALSPKHEMWIMGGDTRCHFALLGLLQIYGWVLSGMIFAFMLACVLWYPIIGNGNGNDKQKNGNRNRGRAGIGMLECHVLIKRWEGIQIITEVAVWFQNSWRVLHCLLGREDWTKHLTEKIKRVMIFFKNLSAPHSTVPVMMGMPEACSHPWGEGY